MASPILALDLIKNAYRKIGVYAPGTTLTAEEGNDGLAALNDVIETWATSNLTLYGQANDTFATVNAQSSYTVGVGGNFNIARPTRILNAYCTVNGVDFPIEVIEQAAYDAIPLKTQPGPIYNQLFYLNNYPLGRIYLWPVPSQAGSLTINSEGPLTQVATLQTSISLPPGYVRALQYAVAVELAGEYGAQPPIQLAIATLAAIKRSNHRPARATYDAALAGGPYYPPGDFYG